MFSLQAVVERFGTQLASQDQNLVLEQVLSTSGRARPHESTYANIINVIVNACSNFHLFGHLTVRSAHCYVTNR